MFVKMEHRDITRKLYIKTLTPSIKIYIMNVANKYDSDAYLKYNYNRGLPFGFIIFNTREGCDLTFTELYENWIDVQRPNGYVTPVEIDNSIIWKNAGLKLQSPNPEEND